jgi:hypothetical protein
MSVESDDNPGKTIDQSEVIAEAKDQRRNMKGLGGRCSAWGRDLSRRTVTARLIGSVVRRNKIGGVMRTVVTRPHTDSMRAGWTFILDERKLIR